MNAWGITIKYVSKKVFENLKNSFLSLYFLQWFFATIQFNINYFLFEQIKWEQILTLMSIRKNEAKSDKFTI